jgi:hypothetical protein
MGAAMSTEALIGVRYKSRDYLHYAKYASPRAILPGLCATAKYVTAGGPISVVAKAVREYDRPTSHELSTQCDWFKNRWLKGSKRPVVGRYNKPVSSNSSWGDVLYLTQRSTHALITGCPFYCDFSLGGFGPDQDWIYLVNLDSSTVEFYLGGLILHPKSKIIGRYSKDERFRAAHPARVLSITFDELVANDDVDMALAIEKLPAFPVKKTLRLSDLNVVSPTRA